MAPHRMNWPQLGAYVLIVAMMAALIIRDGQIAEQRCLNIGSAVRGTVLAVYQLGISLSMPLDEIDSLTAEDRADQVIFRARLEEFKRKQLANIPTAAECDTGLI